MWARSLLLVAGSTLVAGCFLTLDADDFTRGGAPADAASGDAGAPVIATWTRLRRALTASLAIATSSSPRSSLRSRPGPRVALSELTSSRSGAPPSNWFPGNPMDHESCVAISSLPDQHWIDRACSDRYVAICEVDR